MSGLDFSRILRRGLQPPRASGRQRKYPSMHEYGRQLLEATGIDPNLPRYTIEEHVPIIQSYYNQVYPGKYRLVVFSIYAEYRPVYKTKQHSLYDVCLWYDGSHFDGVRTPARLFGREYYCIECERSYQSRVEHTGRCVKRCNECGRMGADFPCPALQDYVRQCSACHKEFSNADCFMAHQGIMCDTYHRCLHCGVVYNARRIRRLSETGQHECDYSFCMKCGSYHRRGRGCYIQVLEPTPPTNPVRFLAFDFECTQNKLVDGVKFQHEVRLRFFLWRLI